MLDTSGYFKMGIDWVRWHQFRILFVSPVL